MQLTTRAMAAFAASLLVCWSVIAGYARADDEAQPVVVVVALSESMQASDADDQGTTRLAAVKQAVQGLITAAPEGSQLGLVVSGAKSNACNDIQTINGVGTFDPAALGQQVDDLQAKGNRPIGPSLRTAAEGLEGKEGPKSIVLVADGEPTCAPPPACDVAREIAGKAEGLTVHTVGFRTAGNAQARETLECIANATGGRHSDAESASELAKQLKSLALGALQGEGSQDDAAGDGSTRSKPLPVVAGQHVVRLKGGERPDVNGSDEERPNVRYFSVPFHDGWDIELSATLATPRIKAGSEASSGRSLMLKGYTTSDGSCSSVGTEYQTGSRDMVDLKASLQIPAGDDSCGAAGDDTRRFYVARFGDGWADRELEVEVTVAYVKAEQHLSTVEDPGASPGQLQLGTPQKIEGGTSFGNATVLKPGETISDEILGLERRYFAVPVQYGQNLQVRLDLAKSQGLDTIGITPYNPLRQAMGFDEPSVPLSGTLSTTVSGEPKQLEAPLQRAILPSHFDSTGSRRAAAFPGMQYIVVGRAWDDTLGAKPHPFTLTTDVWGQPAEGGLQMVLTPESYESTFPGEGDGPSPSPSPSPEPSGSPSPSPEPSPSPSGTGETSAEKGKGGSFPWVPALAGAGGVFVVSGGVWLLIQRRR